MSTKTPEHARSAKCGVRTRAFDSVTAEDFHTCLIIGNETWLHQGDPDTKESHCR